MTPHCCMLVCNAVETASLATSFLFFVNLYSVATFFAFREKRCRKSLPLGYVTMTSDYPCPSCGFLVFGEPPGSYEICPVCGWEDDHVQLRYPGMRGGANSGSLREYQLQALAKFPADVRVTDGLARQADWRPLTDDECIQPIAGHDGAGVGYFNAASEVLATYYWAPRDPST